MGLLLLALGFKLRESTLFSSKKMQGIRRGDLRLLLSRRERVFRYLRCIVIGIPIWYIAEF